MKKIKALLLSACLLCLCALFAFSACGGNTDNTGNTDDSAGTESGAEFKEDTNTYYAIGTGAGDLSASGWNMTYTGLSFVKDTSVTDANVYTLTIRMYTGDHFQIIHDASWNGQMGMSYVAGASSYGSYAYATFGTDGKMELFGGGDYGVDIEAAQAGLYTFTLTTYPGSVSQNTITYTRTVQYEMLVRGDVSSVGISMIDNVGEWSCVLIVKPEDLKRNSAGEIVGEGAQYCAVQIYNGADGSVHCLSGGAYASVEDITYGSVNLLGAGAYRITYDEAADAISIVPTQADIYVTGIDGEVAMSEEQGIWTATVYVKASDYASGGTYAEVSLYDRVTERTVKTLRLSAGTYAIRYDEDGGDAEYEELAYYVVGTFVNLSGGQAAFVIEKGVTPELTETDRKGVYRAEVKVSDMRSAYTWLSDEGGTDDMGNPAVFAIRAVYGSSLNGIEQWLDDGNTFIYATGNAVITYVSGYALYVTVT